MQIDGDMGVEQLQEDRLEGCGECGVVVEVGVIQFVNIQILVYKGQFGGVDDSVGDVEQ